MSSKSCTTNPSVVLRLDLWAVADTTNRQLYTVLPTTGNGVGIIGIPVTILNVGRNNQGCASYAVEGSTSQCGDTMAHMGTKASPGATQWILDAIVGEPGMVHIHNQVSLSGQVCLN